MFVSEVIDQGVQNYYSFVNGKGQTSERPTRQFLGVEFSCGR